MAGSNDGSAPVPKKVDYSIVREKVGHGFEVECIDDDRFPNAILDTGRDGSRFELITLREVTMLGFMNAVTDKPEWHKKVFDESIISKWKQEAVKIDTLNTDQMTEKMFEYCIKELQHRAKQYENDPSGAIYVLPADVYKSDTAVSGETRIKLQGAVRILEDVPANEKDWHPGSNGKVLDLVHPSMFPLVYGVSKILPHGAPITSLDNCIQRCGEGDTITAEEPYEESDTGYHTHSKKFQWLPCEVDVSGERPRIATYINNLHPVHHRELYTVIEEVIAAAIPLWNLTLAPIVSVDEYDIQRRIEYSVAEYTVPPEYENEPEQEEDESVHDFDERYWDWTEARIDSRTVILPEPDDFVPRTGPEPLDLVKDRCADGRRLQVIVKLANIELTPEKPEYEGGTWHVEGQMNESICASAIYYYSSSNITPSRLAFRQQAQQLYNEIGYEQSFREWLPAVFGIMSDEPSIQDLGSVDTREGRLVTFPNIIQHQVQPFKLVDPTKPGHRKILALFLVDPAADIISTADVPVQRRDWWEEEVLKGKATELTNKLNKLPVELKDLVFESVQEFPISLEQAKVYREELMAERRFFALRNGKEFAATIISLCEH